jgi:hypothetical protein
MIDVIHECLSNLHLGDKQKHNNMEVLALYYSGNCTIPFITLQEALELGVITITEVGAGGTVPKLKVLNRADTSVLLLDGEELVGAQQNRILNTTILLKEHSETIIPVSCTEAGRWSSVSAEMKDSDAVANLSVRTKKMSSVSRRLSQSETFESDQGAVWEEIDRTTARAKAHAPTRALRDVYQSKDRELADYLDAFPCQKGQKGIIVSIAGRIVGMDFIARDSAYEKLHRKLVKSYALEALLETKQGQKVSRRKVSDFIRNALKTSEERHRSVGYGWDYRYESADIIGSALVYQKQVIHMAFFAFPEKDKVDNFASFSRRRNYRRKNAK